jgi:RHS repeat-associated protein
MFLPKTAENYTYDLDGNLTSDGRWTNKWDGENRLIDMTSHASGPSGSRKSLQFAYDSLGRRFSKIVSNWTGSAWTRALHEKFVYDGWNLLGVLDGTNNAIVRSFLWGLDLSGSLQGAGGVGGLICFKQHSGSLAGNHFAAYDGNGNVMALVDGSTGTASARYEYDPFGQTIRASGTMATLNQVRFSSKPVDDETDMAYYGHRYLNPNAGRWLSRDPLEETADKNLIAFISNDPGNKVDGDGRVQFGSTCLLRIQNDVLNAIAKACDKILGSATFTCCMGGGLGQDAHIKLKKLCDSRDFTVNCESAPPALAPNACGRGDDKTQTITLFNGFYNDTCASKPCVMAHEMLHLGGWVHPEADTLFGLLHHCLGCPPYP